tara:strand:- start:6 stop:845 length:840 start_codon:yes stop_codon:yes gene_type:complete
MTFYRDAIETKDNYGVEIDTIATGNEGLTIPNIDAFIAPIVTKSDSLTRAGHTVVGSATLYIPALSTIKKNILGISDAGAHNARLSSFNELESKDILYDMEKIIYSADTPTSGNTYTLPSNTSGFEMDRLQFKVIATGSPNRITTVVITDSAGKTLTWTFDSSTNFDNAKYHIVDLPLTNVSASDKAYYIYVPSSGATGIRTVTATIGSSFDIKDVDGETTTLSSVVITSNVAGMTTKDLRLYKAGEWRIEAIKEYRDEYMELGCVKIRGERGSRRRAY